MTPSETWVQGCLHFKLFIILQPSQAIQESGTKGPDETPCLWCFPTMYSMKEVTQQGVPGLAPGTVGQLPDPKAPPVTQAPCDV